MSQVTQNQEYDFCIDISVVTVRSDQNLLFTKS